MENMDREELLRKIQEVEFACIDFNLYLDTHPNDEKALRDYNTLANEAMKLRKIYEINYGPLTNFGFSLTQYPFAWLNEPWPWEGK
ncbi:spore coat protein CotJB [Tepidibacter formicigenes]|jgi:spore coat protein JB|uniref:Spore coat protein JB n=1 Tax=Tepidibacter formicigenes DSM 15518 TaxID=1123349 RepID=A0A1M6NHP7_9FIRM|nr:spore coat protein CotJB [Tepidibacter formicigenes]SHJ95156.1 spore coat protein JB [Tepidibacter formicigenes DSM 15518]